MHTFSVNFTPTNVDLDDRTRRIITQAKVKRLQYSLEHVAKDTGDVAISSDNNLTRGRATLVRQLIIIGDPTSDRIADYCNYLERRFR